MNFKLYNVFNNELETEWNKIQGINNVFVFQTFNWNKIWCENFLDIERPFIYIIYEGDRPIALFPLYLKTFFGVRSLFLIGGNQSDYLSPLFSDKIFDPNMKIGSIWEYFNKIIVDYHFLCFDKVPRNLSLNQLNPIVNLHGFSVTNNSYSANLPQSFEEYDSTLRSKLKSDIKRQVRRLEELGKLSFCYEIDQFNVEKYLNILFKLKSMQYKRTGVIDAFANDKVRKFYTSLFYNKFSSFKPVFSVLKLNDEPIAIHLGVQFSGRFYYLLPAYNCDYQVYSPGKILLHRIMQEAINTKNVVFDFTVGGEEYKREWCNNELVLQRFEYYRGILGYMVKMVSSLFNYFKRDRYIRKILTTIKRIN